MRLSEILQDKCVKVPLEATGKKEAIYELVDLLCKVEDIGDAEALKEAVWQRETTRTTGIGHGVAIPHGKSSGVKKLSMAVGKPKAPIEFGSVDGKPVQLIILLISAMDQTGPHIQALARVSQILMPADVRQAIMEASSPEAVYRLLVESETKVLAAR